VLERFHFMLNEAGKRCVSTLECICLELHNFVEPRWVFILNDVFSRDPVNP